MATSPQPSLFPSSLPASSSLWLKLKPKHLRNIKIGVRHPGEAGCPGSEQSGAPGQEGASGTGQTLPECDAWLQHHTPLCSLPREWGKACWLPRIIETLLLEQKAAQVPVTRFLVGGQVWRVSDEL